MTSNDALRVRLFPRAVAAVARTKIDAILDFFPAHVIARLVENGTRIVPLSSRERYMDASLALRRLGVDIDQWPVPPVSGLTTFSIVRMVAKVCPN